jgi:hypothetical protein
MWQEGKSQYQPNLTHQPDRVNGKKHGKKHRKIELANP